MINPKIRALMRNTPEWYADNPETDRYYSRLMAELLEAKVPKWKQRVIDMAYRNLEEGRRIKAQWDIWGAEDARDEAYLEQERGI